MVAVDSLIPYARNARTHSEDQVAQIAASISEFGFTNPILTDGDKGVIAGHGRLAAARKLALTQVPVIELGHLTAIQKKAYILADNRIAANAGWDEELLKLEIAELDEADFNLDLMGFGDEELERLLNGDGDTTGLTEDDAVPDVPTDPVSKTGDVWVLGQHRLLCGDSTVPILYGWKEGAKHFWCGDRDQSDIWNYKKPHVNDLHPTMKPVELVERAIKNSSKTRDIVIDLFGGSGTTLIACEKTNRQARLMEMDPKYVDVIVKRWEDFTGQKATRESDGSAFADLSPQGQSVLVDAVGSELEGETL